MPRLKAKYAQVKFIDLYKLSKFYYKQKDNKKERMKLDIIGGKITARRNYEYNKSTKEWEASGKSVLFEFRVRSRPVSYKKIDTILDHYYPVYVLFQNYTEGLNSFIKLREGSIYKPKFPKKGANKETRIKIANSNIKKGIQLDFFFHNMQLYSHYGMLYGVNYTNKKMPKKSNPSLIPYLGKHMLYVTEKFIFPLLSNPRFSAQLDKVISNK